MKKILFKQIQETPGKSILIYGGWGIGKTHFAQTFLFKKLQATTEVIYFDVRGIELYPDFIELISHIFKQYINKNQSNIVIAKKTWNVVALLMNGILQTSFPYLKIDQKLQIIKNIKNNNFKFKKKITLIVDELDRVTSGTILKTLNFINLLKTLKIDLKVITIGNKDELVAILSNNLSIKKEAFFLDKYFDNQIDLSQMLEDNLRNIVKDQKIYLKIFDWIKNMQLKANLPSARELKRFVLQMDSLLYVSNAIKQAIFINKIFPKKQIVFYNNAITIEKANFLVDGKFEIGNKEIQHTVHLVFGGFRHPIREFVENGYKNPNIWLKQNDFQQTHEELIEEYTKKRKDKIK